MITTTLPYRSGVGLLLLSQSAGSGREADAKGEGIHDCIGSLLGAGSVLAGDDLAGPDCKGVPVAQAAHIDAIDLHRPHKPQEEPHAQYHTHHSWGHPKYVALLLQV